MLWHIKRNYAIMFASLPFSSGKEAMEIGRYVLLICFVVIPFVSSFLLRILYFNYYQWLSVWSCVGDRGRFPLPDSTPIVHMEFTQFYYPGDMEFPRKSNTNNLQMIISHHELKRN